MNYRLVAIEVGDLLKYDTSVNQINRIGQAILGIKQESFVNDSITSLRARTVHDWILSLAKNKMESTKRTALLISFCRQICPDEHIEALEKILENAGLNSSAINKELLSEFMSRSYHPEIIKHAKKLFLQGHYFMLFLKLVRFIINWFKVSLFLLKMAKH